MTEQVTCVVCNKPTPKLSAIAVPHQGKTFYACGPACRQQFAGNPMRYAQGTSKGLAAPKSPTAPPKSAAPKSTMTSTPPPAPKKP